jgi:DNA-binding winged helix-turn-helix (wHTH) protein
MRELNDDVGRLEVKTAGRTMQEVASACNSAHLSAYYSLCPSKRLIIKQMMRSRETEVDTLLLLGGGGIRAGQNFGGDQIWRGLRVRSPRQSAERRSGRVLKLERIPAKVLAVLVEQRGQVVSREQIVERIWGKGAFLDTDNSINGAIRKIRQVLKDDPEQLRFIQTVTGKGYRFIAPVIDADLPRPVAVPNLRPPAAPLRTDSRARWRWPVLLGIAMVLIAALGFYLHRSRSKSDPHLEVDD